MKTTTTETFDKDGKVIKRETVTEDEQILSPPVSPYPISPNYPPTPWPPGWPTITNTTTTPPLNI